MFSIVEEQYSPPALWYRALFERAAVKDGHPSGGVSIPSTVTTVLKVPYLEQGQFNNQSLHHAFYGRTDN